MTFFEEFRELFRSILHWVYLLVGFSFVFFLLPTGQSFSVLFFKKIEHDLLPFGVNLIVTNPLSAFTSQILLSLLMAFILTLPFFLYRIISYIAPALLPNEKKAVWKALAPSILLFFTGCLFAYYYIIPTTFKILFPYATELGATPFFGINEFISSVLGMMIACGIMFLLPLFMTLLSYLGIINAQFWRAKWRQVLALFLVFSAIITPDGTGVTMALLFFPMMGLYLAGCFLTARLDRSRINR